MNQYRPPSFMNMPPVVKNLIMINVVVFIATWVLGNMNVELTRILGLYYPGSEYFKPFQFVTHMFMHGGIMHLFFNMFALYMFGKVLEMVWGPKRFLIYYFVTGLGAAALHTFVNYLELSSLQHDVAAFINTPSPDLFSEFVKDHINRPAAWVNELVYNWYDAPDNQVYSQRAIEVVNQVLTMKINIPTVGASGAVFGILLAFGVLFPNTQLMLIFPPIPIKAKFLVIGYGILELYLGLSQPSSNIAHFAHLGGMIFGFILIKYWNKTSNHFY